MGEPGQNEKLFININSITDNTLETTQNQVPGNTFNDIIEEIREQRQQEISYTNNTNDKYSFVFMDYIETNKTGTFTK